MMEPKSRTIFSKLIEVFRAFQLEWHYSKAELLELYCSMVPLGGNIEGMHSGALLYYRTPLERLNTAHLADLILIPSDPNRLRPDLYGENLLGLRRREAVRWLRRGVLTPGDSSVLWNTPASVRRRAPPGFAPHFSLRLRTHPSSDSELHLSKDHLFSSEVSKTLPANLLKKHKPCFHVLLYTNITYRNMSIILMFIL